jgi:hypothetical protein
MLHERRGLTAAIRTVAIAPRTIPRSDIRISRPRAHEDPTAGGIRYTPVPDTERAHRATARRRLVLRSARRRVAVLDERSSDRTFASPGLALGGHPASTRRAAAARSVGSVSASIRPHRPSPGAGIWTPCRVSAARTAVRSRPTRSAMSCSVCAEGQLHAQPRRVVQLVIGGPPGATGFGRGQVATEVLDLVRRDASSSRSGAAARSANQGRETLAVSTDRWTRTSTGASAGRSAGCSFILVT